MPHHSSSSSAAAAAGAAILAALTAFFIRRRRKSESPSSALPDSAHVTCIPAPPPLLLVVGHRVACSHLHSLCGYSLALAADTVFLLSGTNAAALEQRARNRNQSATSSAASSAAPASLMLSASSSHLSRLSTQDFARRSLSELLPDTAAPVISAATRAYVAELQNKCVNMALCFENASFRVQVP
jgi:LPXTG-motif cell wall-anchored protein